MRHRLALRLIPLCLILPLAACTSDLHFAADSLWPFGNPNAPANDSETAQRARGEVAAVQPIAPQAGDVWPGPVQPVPTINDIQKNMTLPLGQGYTPSLPSPYPPGQDPDQPPPVVGVPLPAAPPGAGPVVVPAVPGDAR